jgi:predicted PurR-regulated permease PerM
MFADFLALIVLGYVLYRCFDIGLNWVSRAANNKMVTSLFAVIMVILTVLLLLWTVYWAKMMYGVVTEIGNNF